MFRKITPLTALTALITISSPAMADNDHHHKHGSRHERSDRYEHYVRHEAVYYPKTVYYIPVSDHYTYKRSCPPGLAKKHNGCMPPAHAKRYIVGEVLPHDVVYYEVPRHVLVRLEPAPYGTRYVRVDEDVLLISEASKKIIDAFTLLSAVND